MAIAANTIYVASYFAPTGIFAYNNNYFTTRGDQWPADCACQQLGRRQRGLCVHKHPRHAFPNSTYQASNYWVDVVFTTSAASTATQLVIHTQPSPTATAGCRSRPSP